MENTEVSPEDSGAETATVETAEAETAASPEEEKSFAEEIDLAPAEEVNLQTLLKAGAHFGHQTHRWNPKMMPYIFGERNNVHIINLDKTLELWTRARKYIADISSQGGNVLFVGTKQNLRTVVRQQAQRCGAYSVTSRWLGGTLSNFETIKRSIDRIHRLEDLLKQAEDEDSDVKINKKERLGIARELEKLETNLGGIRDMKRHPDLIFVVDVNKESIAVAEARKLHIPVVALVDTNADPNQIAFPIPSNDDSVRTVKLFVAAVAEAILEGRQEFKARTPKEVPSSKKGEASVKASGNGGSKKGDKKKSADEKKAEEKTEGQAQEAASAG